MQNKVQQMYLAINEETLNLLKPVYIWGKEKKAIQRVGDDKSNNAMV